MPRVYKPTIWIVTILLVVGGCIGFWFIQLNKEKPLEVRVILKSTDDSIQFWQVLIDGIHVAAKEFNADVQVTGSRTEADVDEQIALVEQAIEAKPDAIILAANDYNRLVPISEKAKMKGIKLIIVDSGINSNIQKSMIATDNVQAGKKVGEQMLKQLNGPSKLVIINYVKNAASLIDRERGVRSVLDSDGDVTLEDTLFVDGQEETAYAKAKDILRKDPTISGIIGLNEPTSVGAGRAIRELGLSGKVKLIGFDSSFNEIQLLDEGIMQATVIQQPFQMGYLSLKTAAMAVKGKKVEKFIDTGSLVITKSNMYEESNQKLLFPFYDK